MKHANEKNFNILVSLLLEGVGAGFILIPGRLGINNSLFASGYLAVFGLSCFIIALSLQVISVWHTSKKRWFFIQGISIALLIITGRIFLGNGHWVAAYAMLICGFVQLFLFLPLNERIRKTDFLHLTIAVISFATGIILSISGLNIPLVKTPYLPLLAAGFFLTAFLGFVAVVLPSFKYSPLFARTQIMPWLGIIPLYILPTARDNLIAPAALITMLILNGLTPWNRLIVSKEDILSHRVIMTAFFAEIAQLMFLGALLFIIDQDFDNRSRSILSAREATLFFFILFSTMVYYGVTTVIMTSSGLMQELAGTGDDILDDSLESEGGITKWGSRLERYIKPFIMTPEGIRGRIQADQINTLGRRVALEKMRNAQLNLLLELSQQLESQLDPPVSAQLAVNTLERAINCPLVTIFVHEPETKEFMLLAAAGWQTSLIPSKYRQDASKGVIGRALRQRKTQVVNDIRIDPDYIPFKDENSLSAAVVPLIFNGHIHGVITLNNEKTNAFGSLEIGLAETVASELSRAWERSGYDQRLTELIQIGNHLYSAPDPETAVKEAASISKSILQAKFTHIYIQLGQERNFIQRASSGRAPLLLKSLTDPNTSEKLINIALHAKQPFRIRDVRKYENTSSLTLDDPKLRNLLVIPIHWHLVNIGAIFAFGKQNEVFFTENDESLAELISIQAGGAFESTWLQQELHSSFRITSLLYRLSNQIIQADNMEDAIFDIAQTTHRLGRNMATGVVIFDPGGEIIAEIQIDDAGKHFNIEQPLNLIRDAMASGQLIHFSLGESILRTCLPIQTPIRAYGAIWMDARDDSAKSNKKNNDIEALVNQAAIALERSLLWAESRRQAKEIKEAYDTLAATYDQTLASLTASLDARDRDTEGHSMRVTDLSVKLGEELGYSSEKLKTLKHGALLHDIGKIGISDTILHKAGSLTEDEWKIMKTHPEIGAKIVEGIPFLEDTIPLILCHQERWDGSGYPGGLNGADIPELARLFAIIDIFDALTSNRPYRQKISKQEALVYLRQQAGIQLDPLMVSAFELMLQKNPDMLIPTSD